MTKKELEQELADLKAKAIIPKFKIGQRVWVIFRNFRETPLSVEICKIMSKITKSESSFYYEINFFCLNFTIDENQIFATQSEAEEALRKMKGE